LPFVPATENNPQFLLVPSLASLKLGKTFLMSEKIKPIDPPDSMHLNAAEGWLGLGDVVSAHNELDEISPELRSNPAVLLVRYEIYARAKNWDSAAEVSDTLTKLFPDIPAVWICSAYATRRKAGGGIPQAREILLAAGPKFPREYLFPFNLACYCSQLRQFEEAEKWLKKAMAIDDKTVRRLANDDPDLQPLWDSLGGTPWKRG
jgi:tetratricopeptide (TPR) repeat protein